MREHQSNKHEQPPWHVPITVADIAETGDRFDLVADAQTRAAVARMAGLRDLPRLHANFEVTRRAAGGAHVTGKVSATVGQACVVTLDTVVNEVEEEIDLIFAPGQAAEPAGEAVDEDWDEVEPLIDGCIDLGALATEFLVLGLDPYPRKPGAVFQPPADATSDEGPFAALATLKRDRDTK